MPGATDADRLRGGIQIENRQNSATFFPFVSVSIAVKPITETATCRALDIAAELSELKHQAKKIPGNSLFVERRGHCVSL